MKILITLSLVVGITHYVFSINPQKEYSYRPEKFRLEYRELKLKTSDNYELNTWIMEPLGDLNKNKTVIIVGSDAGNMGNVLGQVLFLMKSGYRVVTFDYRGFGDSTDFKFNRDNLYHSEYVTDFVTVMNWCKKEFRSDKIGVLAYSMGTLISAIGYQESEYNFYIGEAFLRNPEIVVSRILEHKGKEIILPDTYIADIIKVEKLDIPILLFASTTDQITTAEDSKNFCESRESSKTIEYDGEHLRGIATMGMESYFEEIKAFVDGN